MCVCVLAATLLSGTLKDFEFCLTISGVRDWANQVRSVILSGLGALRALDRQYGVDFVDFQISLQFRSD